MTEMIDLDKIAPVEGQRVVLKTLDFKLKIIENMETYGGSFVKALAECVRRADRDNLRKLTKAFWNYFLDYQPNKWKKRGGD